ncbi:phosphotransferase [Epibacterium sp. SM1979]|uniref:Phosphotransferase n=1 Tax=Tritonibacter litoralis TaxID=2662264 RepID=A0A843YDJ2_9RHOB|nr:aminoglycoside phosphotransferase family protein [Tritonibacter litoralis]MQQ07725.1 phosphotransferase [Tritonibacter litoralis]
MKASASILSAAQIFDVTLLSCLQSHRVSDVWRVVQPNGQPAVLKAYHTDMGNEAAGFAYLDQFQGQSAARIYRVQGRAVLMEDLPGPSLGDYARSGHDMAAAQILGEVAQRLQNTAQSTAGLLPLEQVFQPMFDAPVPAGFTAAQNMQFTTGRVLAQTLLQAQTDRVPLHGDLHHDNVLNTARGYCAFDAKGMLGDPAYELANAFRHPRKQPDWTTDVPRTLRIAPVWAAALGVTPRHLLSWAVAKVTLSIFWQARAGTIKPVEFQHLQTFDQARDRV